ncbi:MAG: ATP-binding protein [Synechococcus sp. SB0678_bin_12]|nr:ATP-binding protein [Cyanobacteria bacterium MAG IRC1_bin_28]MYF35320.1 ATP-binding protein [Synechococcus sp. SB0678_bin_12]MYI87278.1 ATP-binding protein [Synechococcus sp. SB0672_bin_10]
MPSILPINLEDLLACRGVESQRVEFKAGWDPRTTGPQVLRTICAFANDLQNLNGGYVVIGVAEQDGHTFLLPAGLADQAVEVAQKWIRVDFLPALRGRGFLLSSGTWLYPLIQVGSCFTARCQHAGLTLGSTGV